MMKYNSTTPNRYYLKGEIVCFEEDQTHEFKGHRNISIDEIPPWCIYTPDNNRTRNAISRNLCGFLNSGWGGTVYVGILDGGRVEGVRLTQYQQDHLLLSLQDTLNSFSPPVPYFMYKVEFIPVIEPLDPYPLQFPPVPEDIREQPHYLRSYLFCWCDYDALGSFQNCEDMQIYFRKHSTIVKYSMHDVEEQAKEELLLYKMPQLMKAWKKWRTYSRLLQLVKEATARQEENSSTEKKM